ncbi:MAG: ABC transporter ATP-binding protein [Polyangiaceae bacterium]|nr:ABC transporter ATP-binding protein [Polyangiaceae bacterium]
MSEPAAPRVAGAEPALRVASLEVRYGGIRAVKGVSLEVAAGEIVTLIGANGAGKTSTLKAIIGLVPAAAGEIHLLGAPTRGVPTHRLVARGVQLVPEGRAIFGNLTVLENLQLGGYVSRDPRRLAERLERVVALFPRLGERLKQEGGTLSGGEQQMLAIGRALMADPKLLLLDEPSLGLAPKIVQEVFAAIRAVAATGITILLVEQNTRLALETAQRAYVLVTGEIVISGAAAELREDPRIRAAYLGEAVH